MKLHRSTLQNYIYMLLLISSDFFALLLSLKIAIFFRINFFNQYLPSFDNSNIANYYWILVLPIFAFIYEGIYSLRQDFWSDTKSVLKGLLLSFIMVLTIITLTKISNDYSRAFIVIFFTITFLLVPSLKRVFKKFLFRFDTFKIKVKIIASDTQYETLKQEIEENKYIGLKHSDKNYDMVIISSKKTTPSQLQELIKRYIYKTKDIYVIPYMEHLDLSNANIINYSNIRLSAIHIENRLLNIKNLFIKYMFEKFLVLLLLPFIMLIHIFISLLIKFDSNGEVIFRQKRLGKDSRSFWVFKYRTMYKNSDKILGAYLKEHIEEVLYYKKYHKYKNDPRVTKVGKFLRKTSLDELPQFFNIIKGDMNLIGPRPYMVSEKQEIGKLNEEIILKVKPGITGLWQVSGRNELTFKERLELDAWYIQNWSLWMDFTIFVKTLNVVLMKVGAK